MKIKHSLHKSCCGRVDVGLLFWASAYRQRRYMVLKIRERQLRLLFLMFVLHISSFVLNAQSHISVYANGSINYTPMRNVEHDFISWNVVKIDRFNYSPNIGIKYFINDYNKIILNFEYLQINLSYGVYNSAEIHYELFIYPIELGYEYKFTNHPAVNSFIGAGIGYVFLNSEYVYQSGPPSYTTSLRKDGEYSFTVKYGLEYRLSNILDLFGVLRYRYAESIRRSNYQSRNDVNVSGISLLLGVQLNI